MPGLTSVPTSKSPLPENATFFSAAFVAPASLSFSSAGLLCADDEEPLPVLPEPLSFPLSPAFAETTPITTTPTTALSVSLPFIPMTASPPKAATAFARLSLVRWVNESIACEPSQHGSQNVLCTRP